MEFETMADLVAADLLFSQRCYVYSQAQDTMVCTGVGAGKTLAICLRGIHLNYFMPGNQGLITTDTETHLENTTQKVFFEICPPGLIVKIDRGKNLVRLRTKDSRRYSTIYFRHLNESRPGRKHLSGLDLGWYSCDQLEDCEKDEWDYLMTRLRRPGVGKKYRFAAMNSKGKEWCYRRYFKPAIEKNKITETQVPGLLGELVTVKEYFPAVNRYSILGPTEENIHLDKNFLEDMLATQTKEYLQRYVYAGFEEWAGKIYKDYSMESKHNIFSFPIPNNFPCIVSIDVGGDSPWAILVGRQDPFSGDLFIADEMFEPGLIIREIVSWLRSCDAIPDISKARFICDPENKLAIAELAEHGVYCEAARKGPKLPGILRVGGYFKPKKGRLKQIDSQPGPNGTKQDIIVEDAPTLWVFKDKCPNFVEEHDGWVWQRQAGTGYAIDKPVDVADHTCFVAGTKIDTHWGGFLYDTQSIENLKRGQMVSTPAGLRSVMAIGQRQAATIDVSLSDGRKIRCTPDHPFFTPDGFIYAMMSKGEILGECGWLWKTLWKLHRRVKNLGTKYLSSEGNATTNPATTGIARTGADFIAMSGKRPMGIFRRTATFITRTMTDLITILKTWAFYPSRITIDSTWPLMRVNASQQLILSRMLSQQPRSGEETIQERLPRWLDHLLRPCTKRPTVFGRTTYATTAAERSRPDPTIKRTTGESMAPSAASTARWRIVAREKLITLKRHALCVGISFLKIAIRLRRPVRVVAVEDSSRMETVYNITVEDAHSYYADGILVSNCDALIYLCRVLPPVEELPKLNPAMEALRRTDPLSYEATKQIQAGRAGRKFSQTGGEAWSTEVGEIDRVYKDIDLSGIEW